MDERIAKLIESIDSHGGSVGWTLKRACRELKLGISPAYAARLFKRQIGLDVREYAKKERLLMAAERLTATDLPIKVIAAEFGYRKPNDFTRIFTEEHRLSPRNFRKRTA